MIVFFSAALSEGASGILITSSAPLPTPILPKNNEQSLPFFALPPLPRSCTHVAHPLGVKHTSLSTLAPQLPSLEPYGCRRRRRRLPPTHIFAQTQGNQYFLCPRSFHTITRPYLKPLQIHSLPSLPLLLHVLFLCPLAPSLSLSLSLTCCLNTLFPFSWPLFGTS